MPWYERPDGCRLYYEVHGPTSERTLILLEGLGGDIPGRRRAASVGARGKVPKDRPYLALYSEAFARDHPDHVAEDVLVGSQNPQPLHAGRRQWEAVEEWDAWARLGELHVPTLVVHGTD